LIFDGSFTSDSFLSWQGSRFISSGNPVFPKMVPVSSQNNKILDAESHSSKSKRKMFKVVQRKRTTPDEPEILCSEMFLLCHHEMEVGSTV
jgi:hypothetical protein